MDARYDVFVSHNGLDKPVVERLCWALLEAGLRPWLDKWDLAPGDVWMAEVERVLATVPAVIVCVGEHGLSAWHDAERQAALARSTSTDAAAVIPVLLPGAPQEVELPVFLRAHQPVDLRAEPAWDDGVARLAASLTGEALPRAPTADEVRVRPYRGLRAFTEADAGWMFGREQEEQKLLAALREGQRFITVVGASGSGKSSLVRAGVIPAVRTGAFDGRQRWHALVMRPGARPCQALAVRLLELQHAVNGTRGDAPEDPARLDALREQLMAAEHGLEAAVELLLGREEHDAPLLLVVDQLEELFTERDGSSAERAGSGPSAEGLAFLRNLFHATEHEGARVRVMLTLRADFTGECLAVPELARRMDDMHFALPPMTAAQLHDVIRRPALRVGYDVEHALVDVLVEATVGHAGRLPLLQHTLDLLWDVRDRQKRRLTYAAYDEHIGSLDESVARRAESVLAALVKQASTNEAVTRRVFSRLVHLGEATGDTRRKVLRSELAGDPAALAVLDAFVDARLLVTDVHREPTGGPPEQAAEIAHEALLGRWKRLRRWLDENREVLRMRQELGLAADEWQERGRPADELWRGGRLARACETLAAGTIDLSPDEQAFLDAARAAEAAERRAKERRQRRLLWGTSAAAAVLLGTSLLAGWQYLAAAQARIRAQWLAMSNERLAVNERTLAARAQLEREIAVRERRAASLAARAERGSRATILARIPGRELEALELGVRAVGSMDDERTVPPQAARGLHEAMARARRVVVIDGQAPIPMTVAWTRDGTGVLTTDGGGQTTRWDPTTSAKQITIAPTEDETWIAEWSPDATRVATGNWDGRLRLWDAATGTPLVSREGHAERVSVIAWTSDGTRLVTGSEDHTARLWDGRTAEPLATLRDHSDAVVVAAWAPDGTRLATGSEDHTVALWDGHTGGRLTTLRGHDGPIAAVRWSADGTRLATASGDGTAKVWDAATGTLSRTLALLPPGRTTHQTMSLAWTSGGTRLATVVEGDTAMLWNVDTGVLVAPLGEREERVHSLAATPDGTRLATASDEPFARLWDPATGASVATLSGHTESIAALAWSADGSRLATLSFDETARLWDATTIPMTTVIRAHDGSIGAMEWAPDGKRLATASEDRTAKLWDVETMAEIAALRGHTKRVARLAWTPDGKRLATTSWDDTVRLWSSDGEPVAILGGRVNTSWTLAWAPDGSRLAAGSQRAVRLWDGTTGAELAHAEGHEGDVRALAWAPDGSRLATASQDHTARLWDGRTGAALAILRGHSQVVTMLAWAPDGSRLATAGDDAIVQLWDGRTGAALATVRDHYRVITAVAWAPDGSRLVTASDDDVTQLWDPTRVEAVALLRGHATPVKRLAWAPVGSRLVTASDDSTARLWNGETGELVAALEGHAGAVHQLAWTRDGTRLATASWKDTVMVWDGATGEPVATIHVPAGDITSLAWSPDGERLALSSSTGLVTLWRASPRAWLGPACEVLEGSTGAVVLHPDTRTLCAAHRPAPSPTTLAPR